MTVTFSLGELAPGELIVAKSPRRDGAGVLAHEARLRERLVVSTTNGRLRSRARDRLRPGISFARVSKIAIDGTTDCTLSRSSCGQVFSNVLRVDGRAKDS